MAYCDQGVVRGGGEEHDYGAGSMTALVMPSSYSSRSVAIRSEVVKRSTDARGYYYERTGLTTFGMTSARLRTIYMYVCYHHQAKGATMILTR